MKHSFPMMAALVLACAPALADESAAKPVAAEVAAQQEVEQEVVAPEAQVAAPDPQAAAPESAPAASGQEIGTPAPGKGQIVFFRPSKMTGALIGFKVREGDKELGVLKNGNYFVLTAEPGKHQYTVHSEAKDVLTMEVEAGEVYFVQGGITMGIMAGRPNLSPATEAAFTEVKGKLKQSSL